MSGWTMLAGDCVEVMAAMDEASVDAVVTDPPYGLEFMGKEWDRLGGTVEAFDEAQVNGRTDYHGKGNAPFGGGGQRVRYGSSVATMQAWHHAWAAEALRVLKPGGHLLAFGGTRTYHRLTCALEDAGFEIRDSIAWFHRPEVLPVEGAREVLDTWMRFGIASGVEILSARSRTGVGRSTEGSDSALVPVRLTISPESVLSDAACGSSRVRLHRPEV